MEPDRFRNQRLPPEKQTRSIGYRDRPVREDDDIERRISVASPPPQEQEEEASYERRVDGWDESFGSATRGILRPSCCECGICTRERVVSAGCRLRALEPHAAVPHSLRVLMRQVHLAPTLSRRPIHPFPAVPSTTSFTWTLPTSSVLPFQLFAYQASPTGQ